MNYREKLYSTYVSNHTAHLYGEAGIGAIRKQFPVWGKYCGKFLPDDRGGGRGIYTQNLIAVARK